MRTVHPQQAGSGSDEVLSTWCDRIDSMLPDGEAASTKEEEATTAARLGATKGVGAQTDLESLEANEEAPTKTQLQVQTASQRVWRQKERHQQKCRHRQESGGKRRGINRDAGTDKESGGKGRA